MRENTEGCLGLLGIGLFIAALMLFRLPMSGEHVGYVTAVDKGIFCTDVYVKTDLASSQEDMYTIPNSNELLEVIKEARDNKSSVKLNYKANQFSICKRDITKIEFPDTGEVKTSKELEGIQTFKCANYMGAGYTLEIVYNSNEIVSVFSSAHQTEADSEAALQKERNILKNNFRGNMDDYIAIVSAMCEN